MAEILLLALKFAMGAAGFYVGVQMSKHSGELWVIIVCLGYMTATAAYAAANDSTIAWIFFGVYGLILISEWHRFHTGYAKS